MLLKLKKIKNNLKSLLQKLKKYFDHLLWKFVQNFCVKYLNHLIQQNLNIIILLKLKKLKTISKFYCKIRKNMKNYGKNFK